MCITHKKIGSESNFDVVLLSADVLIVLNWNLTLFSLPRLVKASLDSLRSNESSFAQTAGREKAGGGVRVVEASKITIKRYEFNSCLGSKYAGYSRKIDINLIFLEKIEFLTNIGKIISLSH